MVEIVLSNIKTKSVSAKLKFRQNCLLEERQIGSRKLDTWLRVILSFHTAKCSKNYESSTESCNSVGWFATCSDTTIVKQAC